MAVLERPGHALVSAVALFASTLAAWWIYVPLHELLHAWGCLAAGRDRSEVTELFGTPVAPDGVGVRNPAFDITPARYVHAIVTERGIARPPFTESLQAMRER